MITTRAMPEGTMKVRRKSVRTNIGPKETPAVRVYLADPKGVTLQIRRERQYIDAWLSFADALAIADAICEAVRKSGAQ